MAPSSLIFKSNQYQHKFKLHLLYEAYPHPSSLNKISPFSEYLLYLLYFVFLVAVQHYTFLNVVWFRCVKISSDEFIGYLQIMFISYNLEQEMSSYLKQLILVSGVLS